MLKDYLVVMASSATNLSDQVNALMSKGYVPLGGVSVVYATWENDRKGYQESETTYHQAMAYKAE